MMTEFYKSVETADSKTKGYKYSCAGIPYPCKECAQKLVSFITQDVKEAYEHSKRNNVAMWISKD